ncbi:hypothetical protein ACFO4E_13285 [Nocardiopsis mangrovi]|uniref:Uncharacterized protein n=1 Tax=Nocardiopsis mangrovi TaxID=1179818 RepID=A0ABV9DY28_9ACTN
MWQELGLDPDVTRTHTVWRGTRRLIELDFGKIRSGGSMSLERHRFVPEAQGALRVVIDFPFDEGSHSSSEARTRVQELRDEFTEPPATLA